MCIKLKYIQISLDIYQHISDQAEPKKQEINTSTMKTHQMPNKWQYLTCIKVPFSNQDLQNDIMTPRLSMKVNVSESCIIIKLIWTIFIYNQN